MVIKASTVTGVEMSVEYKEIKQDEKFPSLALGDPIPWLGVPALVGAVLPLDSPFLQTERTAFCSPRAPGVFPCVDSFPVTSVLLCPALQVNS